GQIGVASLLLQGDVPVLTAGLVGTFQALPRGGGFPRPVPVEVRFSERVEPGAVAEGLAPRVARRVLRDRVMAGIAKVLPESMQGASYVASAPSSSPPA